MFTNTQHNTPILSRREMDLANFNKALNTLCQKMSTYHNLLFETSIEIPENIYNHVKEHYTEEWRNNKKLVYLRHESEKLVDNNPAFAESDVQHGNYHCFKFTAKHAIPGTEGTPTLFGTPLYAGDAFRMVGRKGLCKVQTNPDNWPTVAITGMAPVEIPIDYSPIRWFSKGLIPMPIKSRAKPLYDIDPMENRAIETLREMISEEDLRRYLKYGFLNVTGKSGYIYQIDRNKSHTIIWNKGIKIGEVCIRIKRDTVPPTDNVIAFKTMVEADEDFFKKQGNYYKATA